MMTFWILAFGLCVVAVAFILLPGYFMSREQLATDSEDRVGLNVSIYEERAAEYEASFHANEISQSEWDQLILELKKNLLTETVDLKPESRSQVLGKLPMGLAVLVPVFALFSYSDFGLSWGSIGDLALAEEIRTTDPHDTEGMRRSVQKLAARLASQPDNDEGWYLLAQSYMNFKMYGKAAETFKHLFDRFPTDIALSAYYAEAVYLADDRQMTNRAKEAVAKALSLNPHDITMLEIQALGLFRDGDLQASVDSFRKALASGADPERAGLIDNAIARIEEDMIAQGKTPGVSVNTTLTRVAQSTLPSQLRTESGAESGTEPSAITTTQSSKPEAVGGRKIQILVEVADSVKVAGNASVFIFARALNGPPMPLAVERTVRSDLPKLVVLDESMAMMAGMGLANFDQVQVVARISSSGIANVSPDDYEALSSTIDLRKENSVIKLRIEKQVKDRTSN